MPPYAIQGKVTSIVFLCRLPEYSGIIYNKTLYVYGVSNDRTERFRGNENARNNLTGACRAIPRTILSAATSLLAYNRMSDVRACVSPNGIYNTIAWKGSFPVHHWTIKVCLRSLTMYFHGSHRNTGSSDRKCFA